MSNEMLGTPIIEGCFRGIGFDTEMWPDRCEETLFFWIGYGKDYERMDSASPEAVQEFIDYYEHQIQVAKDYLRNGRNPKTHEWK